MAVLLPPADVNGSFSYKKHNSCEFQSVFMKENTFMIFTLNLYPYIIYTGPLSLKGLHFGTDQT